MNRSYFKNARDKENFDDRLLNNQFQTSSRPMMEFTPSVASRPPILSSIALNGHGNHNNNVNVNNTSGISKSSSSTVIKHAALNTCDTVSVPVYANQVPSYEEYVALQSQQDKSLKLTSKSDAVPEAETLERWKDTRAKYIQLTINNEDDTRNHSLESPVQSESSLSSRVSKLELDLQFGPTSLNGSRSALHGKGGINDNSDPRQTNYAVFAIKSKSVVYSIAKELPGLPAFMYIAHVIDGSPADKAGLMCGDIFIVFGKIDYHVWTANACGLNDISDMIKDLQPHECIAVKVVRKCSSNKKDVASSPGTSQFIQVSTTISPNMTTSSVDGDKRPVIGMVLCTYPPLQSA
jgi:hypothetical protein